MSLPSSGTISMSQINVELGRSASTTISLKDASTGVYGAINQSSASKPDGIAPYTINEWHGYTHSGGGGGGTANYYLPSNNSILK